MAGRRQSKKPTWMEEGKDYVRSGRHGTTTSVHSGTLVGALVFDFSCIALWCS